MAVSKCNHDAAPSRWPECPNCGEALVADSVRSSLDWRALAIEAQGNYERALADLEKESDAGDDATLRAVAMTTRALRAEAEVERLRALVDALTGTRPEPSS